MELCRRRRLSVPSRRLENFSRCVLASGIQREVIPSREVDGMIIPLVEAAGAERWIEPEVLADEYGVFPGSEALS
jgi:hypothetical protein